MAIFLLVFAVVSALILAIHIALSVGIISNLARKRQSVRTTARAPSAPRSSSPCGTKRKTLPRLLKSLRAQTRRDVLVSVRR